MQLDRNQGFPHDSETANFLHHLSEELRMFFFILFNCCCALAKPYGWLRRRFLLYFLLPFYLGVDEVSKIDQLLLHSSSQETRAILAQMEADLAPDCHIENHLFIHNGRHNYANLSIGSKAYVGKDCFFDLSDRIIIEPGAVIAMRVTILTHFDAGPSQLSKRIPRLTKPVHIHAGAYVGAGAVLLPGISIGEGAVVGAGAVVTKDMPSGALFVGVPARAMLQEKSRSAPESIVRIS
jgi:acetyltransferase-like isoleucine patch superfamily enzyme